MTKGIRLVLLKAEPEKRPLTHEEDRTIEILLNSCLNATFKAASDPELKPQAINLLKTSLAPTYVNFSKLGGRSLKDKCKWLNEQAQSWGINEDLCGQISQ